jgi:hypothetical protein
MVILSNGYKLPETGDFGDVWFPALEDNITRVNSHNHDGNNSEKLSSTNVASFVQTILSGDFVPSGDEFVAAGVTLAGGAVDVDNTTVQFRDPTTKEPIYLKYEKATQTQIDVYTSFVQDFEVLIL